MTVGAFGLSSWLLPWGGALPVQGTRFVDTPHVQGLIGTPEAVWVVVVVVGSIPPPLCQ